ncbi:MAG: hypothetical protein OXB98_12330 [Bryobacterales bacterium]|nr:hypothetical protein [Bryobacterales bacterium]
MKKAGRRRDHPQPDAATVYTIFMTVSNIGHVFGNWLVGPLREGLALS